MAYKCQMKSIIHERTMKILLFLQFSTLVITLVLQSPSQVLSTNQSVSFVHCLQRSSLPPNILFTPDNPKYTSLLFSSFQNNRTLFNSPKPLLIITPTQESHVSIAVLCSKELNVPLRTRSGGHDYEGLSYTTTSSSFIIIDLQKFRSITIDLADGTAWAEAGATLGELYYAISTKSKTLAFPAGECPSIGLGGHISGGGMGSLIRSYGLAIDNIVDAKIVTSNGEILDREYMGEDLFWAIRGGGGASFGVILSYKLKLVKVPPKVSVFYINKSFMRQDATKILSKWQQIAYNLDKRLFMRVILQVADVDQDSKKMIQVAFQSFFLGEKKELLYIMGENFSWLKLQSKDCLELSWIRAVLHNAGYPQNVPLDKLLDRTPLHISFKYKSDFQREPITDERWEVIFNWLLQERQYPFLIIDPLGGRMDEVNETDTPFPHRKGNLYIIQYGISWEDPRMEVAEKHINWIRKFYGFMAPYVSQNPRATYLNYRDLDLGRNLNRNASYLEARVWGEKYFKGNFRRLAHVKAIIDPENLFWNVQSIPPFA